MPCWISGLADFSAELFVVGAAELVVVGFLDGSAGFVAVVGAGSGEVVVSSGSSADVVGGINGAPLVVTAG